MGETRREASCNHHGAMVQEQELAWAQGKCGVSATFVVAEFNLVGIVAEQLDDGAYLAADEAVLRQVDGECDHVEQSWLVRHSMVFYRA